MASLTWLAILGFILPMVLSQEVVPETTKNREDLCKDVKCKKPKGSWCQVIDGADGVPRATCVCPRSCPGDQGGPVCSVFGKQYDNLCQFHRFSCKKKKVIQLAFDKACIASQEPCTKDEYSQFPSRLLEWFMHLKEKDEFGRIDPSRRISYMDMDSRKAIATWKFNELDENQDRNLDKRELLRFRYRLMPLEHCASPFFTRCAKIIPGDAKRISNEEWMKCLKVEDMEEVVEDEADIVEEDPEDEEDEEDVEEEQGQGVVAEEETPAAA